MSWWFSGHNESIGSYGKQVRRVREVGMIALSIQQLVWLMTICSSGMQVSNRETSNGFGLWSVLPKQLSTFTWTFLESQSNSSAFLTGQASSLLQRLIRRIQLRSCLLRSCFACFPVKHKNVVELLLHCVSSKLAPSFKVLSILWLWFCVCVCNV